jgi:hypothetical protein
VSGTEITTDRTVVALAEDAVAEYRRQGRTAVRLAVELCEGHASSIMSGHAATLPLRSVSFLDAAAKVGIEKLVAATEGAA